MSLHALHKRAQWYGLPERERTKVQRLAARTQGVVTPANAISLVGALVTIAGLWLFVKEAALGGLMLVGIGRICDIADGHVARRTHTASPIGEGVDAALDKVVLLAAAVLLTWHGVLPLAPLIVLAVLQVGTAVLALAVRHDGTGLHPTRVGKYATFSLWVAVGLFMIASLASGTGHAVWYGSAYVCFVAALVGSTEALREYMRAALRKHMLRH